MRHIANTNNIAEIQFGVAGGSSVSGKSGAQIVRDLNELARNISEGSSQPKITFGVANTAEQLNAEITKIMGAKPVMLNFGFGAPSATTKQSVRKYSDELIGEFQNSTGKLQTVLQTAFVKGGKDLIFKKYGTSAKDAAAEIDRLNGYIDQYGKIINSLPKVTEAMHVNEAKGLFNAWMDEHQNDQFIRAKNGMIELDSVWKYANSLSLSTNDEIISFFNVIQQGALAADDRVIQLEETLDKLSKEDFSALDMSQMLGSNKFADVLFQRIPEAMRTALEEVNQELTANGAMPIGVDQLISFDRETLLAHINETLRDVMQEIEVAAPSGAGAATTALKFKADVSPEAQEELRASINDLVANATSDAFTIRFVADTSAEGLAAFSESLNAFSQLNNGQPVEVAITAGTSQETVEKLAESIRTVVEQVEGKEFNIKVAPAEGTIESLRQQVEQGFEEAIDVNLKITDQTGHDVGDGSLVESTQALQHHVDALEDAIALEQEKTKVAHDLTTALNAEATSIEKAENAKASRKPRQTADEKKQAELEKLYADKVAEQNRADEKRQAEMEKRAQQRHDAAVKARQKEAQEEARAAERAAKQRAKAAEQEAKAEEKAAKDAAKAAEQAAQEKQKAAEAGKKAEQRAAKQAESSSLTYDKLTNKLTQYYHNFAGEIQKNPALMAQYEQVLNNLNLRGFGQNMTQAAAAVQQFQIACEQAGVGANGFIKKIISGFSNKLFYGGMAKLAAEVRRLVREIYTAVKDIDSSLTQLRIVTGGSAEDMARYYDDAAASANRLAVSIKDVIDATTVYARLGYSARESNVLAEYTAMLTKVGDIDTQAATDAVTALVKAFDLDVSDVQAVMDQMVEVGNNFPISVSQLAEGMNNAGSALAAAGNTVDEAFALLTAANTTVQDISKASTALRTMSARIRKTTAEEMPEGEEAITESKYNALVQSLSKYKVSLVDINNEYRSTYDIIKDIAAVWDQMSSMEQAALAESIAGTRNQNVFYSLVNQFKEAEGALDAAQNASGAMSQAYDAYLESIEGHIGILKADFEDLSTTILNSDILKVVIDVVDGLVKIVDYLAEIKILLPGIIAIIASIDAAKKMKALSAPLDLFIASAQASTKMTGALAASFLSLNQTQQQYALAASATANQEVVNGIKQVAAINQLDFAKKEELATSLTAIYVSQGKTEAEIQDLLALRGLSNAQLVNSAATDKGTASNLAFGESLKLMWQNNPVGLIITAASILASVIIPLVSSLVKTIDELIQEYETASSKVKELNDEYKTNAERIEELIKLKGSNDFTEEMQDELDLLRDQNDALKLEIEMRERLLEFKKQGLSQQADKEFTDSIYGVGQDPTGEYSRINILQSDIDQLKELRTEYADAYSEFVSTGDETHLNAVKAKIERLNSQALEIVNKYYNEKDSLSDDLIAIIEPMIGEYKDASDNVTNVMDEMLKAIDNSLNLHGIPGLRPESNSTASEMLRLKHLAEEGKISFGEYNKQLKVFLRYVNSIGDKHLPASTKALLKDLLALGGTSQHDLNKLGIQTANAIDIGGAGRANFAQAVSSWASTLSYPDLQDFIDFLEQVDLVGVQTFDDLIAKFKEWKATVDNADIKSAGIDFEGLNTLQEQLSLLNTAFKEIKEDGSFGVTYKTLVSIADKFKDVDGIDTYINRLAAAGTNAKEVQSILRDLAYQQIIATNNSEALANASDDVVAALLREAGVSSQGKQAIYELRLAMVAANTTGMDFSSQCNAILELAATAGVATSSLRNMFSAATNGDVYETTDELDSEFNSNGGIVANNRAHRQQIANNQRAGLERQAAAAGMSVEQFTIQKAYEQVKKSLASTFEFTGGATGSSGGGGATEAYLAEIDKYRDAIRALEEAQARREKLEHEISRTDDPQKEIAQQREVIETYVQEQNALHTVNELRRATIRANIEQLEKLGFVVEYNANTNDFWVVNLEHLNELEQDQIQTTEELINATDELNEDNKDASQSWWDLQESIEDAHKEINSLLQDIVDRASKAVDQIQDVYDTLHKAADEYASSGYVSIDTVQALIGLGTEYMQYLIDENGQLVINEETIRDVIKAKMEQLAVENALVYVESLSIAKKNNDIKELNRLLFATEETTKGTWDLVYAQIEMLNLSDEERAAAYHNVNTIRALAQSAGNTIGNELDKMKSGVDDILSYVQDMLKHQSQEAVDALNKQKEAYSEIIDQQKESLQLKKQESDYNKSVEQKLKDIAKLQAKIDALSLDTSREAQAQRAKLLEELAEQQEALADEQNEHAISAQEDALDQMNEDYAKQKDKEIELEEKKYASAQQLYDAAITYIEEHWDTLYSELIEWNTSYGNVLNSEITAAWDNCLAAAQRYGDYVTAHNLLGSAGEEGRNTGVVGTSWGNGSSSSTSTSFSSTADGHSAVRGLIEEMKANSAAWHSASNDERTRLSDRNIEIATVELPKYGLTGVWRDKNGVWRTHDGSPLYEWFATRYHSGGIVGDSTLRQDELFATLQKGELVLTKRQQETVADVVEFMSALKSRLTGAISRTRVPSIGTSIYRDILSSAGEVGGTTVTFGDVYITGTDKDNIAKYREVNREFVNEVMKVLNVRR